jgi:hypothetical protein
VSGRFDDEYGGDNALINNTWESEGPFILEVIGWNCTLILCAAQQ